MRCAQVQGLFSEIYDGIAEAGATQHLLDCPACAAEYKRFSQLLDELRQLPEPGLPVGFHESMMEKVREAALLDKDNPHKLKIVTGKGKGAAKPSRHTTKKAASISRRWAGVAAAACVLLISLWAVRVFDLPGARLADSAAYNMMLPQAESVAPAADFFVAADAEDEAADDMVMGEPVTEEMFDEDAPLYPQQRMAPAETDEEYGLEYNAESAIQYAAASAAPMVDQPPSEIAPGIFSVEEDAEEEPGLWADLAGGIREDGYSDDIDREYADVRWGEGRQLYGRDVSDIPELVLRDTNAITMRVYGIDDMSFELYLAGGGGISPWDIAFIGGIALLCIALGAMLWNYHKTKKGRN